MTGDAQQSDQLLQALGLSSEDCAEVHRLVATHGNHAAQHVVDLIQAALRANDDVTAQDRERILRLIELHDRQARLSADALRTLPHVSSGIRRTGLRVIPGKTPD
ncbi:hypothetical protein [Sphingobium sp.]|uniref:hypothetical protein n=1 Tax=Sphingobium sp. TaxID=1912891 RepID=UPI002E1CA736